MAGNDKLGSNFWERVMENTEVSREKLVSDLRIVIGDAEELLKATAQSAGAGSGPGGDLFGAFSSFAVQTGWPSKNIRVTRSKVTPSVTVLPTRGEMLVEPVSGDGHRPRQRAVPALGWRRARPRSLQSGWRRPGR